MTLCWVHSFHAHPVDTGLRMNPIIAFRAIPDKRGGSSHSQVTPDCPQFSRHHRIPPLPAERSDSIGWGRRQTRATSCTEIGEKRWLLVNKCPVLVKFFFLKRPSFEINCVSPLAFLEVSYLNWSAIPAIMARKDYEAEKGNVSSLTSWQQQVGRFSQLFTKWLLKSHTKPWWTYITGCTGYEVGYNIKFDFMCESATLPLRFITNSTWKKTMIENKWVLAHGVKKPATHGSSVKNKLHKLVWTLAILLITTSVLCVCVRARATDRGCWLHGDPDGSLNKGAGATVQQQAHVSTVTRAVRLKIIINVAKFFIFNV